MLSDKGWEIARQVSALPVSEQTELVRIISERARSAAMRRLEPGARVSFRSRFGVEVTGVVERVMQKNVRVKANFDKFGTTPHPVTWTVSPQLITVL